MLDGNQCLMAYWMVGLTAEPKELIIGVDHQGTPDDRPSPISIAYPENQPKNQPIKKS
jgi:hypothetical protein